MMHEALLCLNKGDQAMYQWGHAWRGELAKFRLIC